jgi:hypothetical protein
MATLFLTGSVGSGAAKKGLPHNASADVAAVRDRLVELGYDWVSGTTAGTEKDFIRAIKLFQSICKGSGKLDQGDGRVDLEGNTYRWLAAENAPGWVKIFGQSGIGWQCTNDFVESNGGFTTTWMREALDSAGRAYRTQLVALGLGTAGIGFLMTKDAPPMWVRECSPTRGGNAAGHGSHETGLDVDMRLPLHPPDQNKWTDLGNNGFKNKKFNRLAGEFQLKAIKAAMNPQLVLFNDPDFIRARLCTRHANHDQHFHIRIKPPVRKEGIINLGSLAGQIAKPFVDTFERLF